MAGMADAIRAAVGQAQSGQALDSNSLPNDGGDISVSSAVTNSDDSVRAGDSTVDTDLSVSADSSEDTQTDSPESTSTQKAEAKADKVEKPGTSTKEVITVTDETGRKRRIEIDYSDRNAVKKAHELAAGSRKWQAERDQAIQKSKSIETRTAELQKNWDSLDSAFQKGGIEGLVDLLEGRPGAFQAYVSKQAERARFLENATPEERAQLEHREAAERDRREVEKLRKENEDFKKSITAERETAEERAMESKIHPVFDKYRFADKLGDSEDEHMFDQMLWNTALTRLEEYEQNGLQVSPELIEREFRDVSSKLKKRISVQAERRASKAVERVKQEATENVQSAVRSGYRGASSSKDAQDLLNNGNLTGLLKNWGSYKGLFQGKK